ncbi:MAG: hypothetical protein Q7S43_04090 [bacterium]|nr:hypothetical protein [bacterium]
MVDQTEQQLFEQIEASANETRRQELELEELKSRKSEKTEERVVSPQETWEEIRRANQLASQQAAYQEQRGQTSMPLFSGPSLFKYALILLFFAIPNDLIDAIDITGLGMIVSWFISTFLSVATLFLVWFTDSELQRVRSHIANKGKYQEALAKTATKIAVKLNRFAPKNPVVKILTGAILEMIPIISLLPWSSISVFLAYADERRTFKEARKMSELEEMSPLSETVPEMV